MIRAIWTEIPARNIERALRFYTTLFELEPVEIVDDGPRRRATLVNTSDGGGTGISLNQTDNFEPGNNGVLVYLHVGEDLTDNLNRVEAAGGKIFEAKTSMGQAGYYATIEDTEGNVLDLYSEN
jgi:hypothetical protein